ncbi:MAG: ABC transporter permease [Chitinophagaceae bacterium]
MIRNYFKVAFRNITRYKGFSLLNVLGLAVGIASCLMLFLVVKYELSYDKFLPGYESVYHIITKDKETIGEEYTSGVPFPLYDAIKVDMPGVTAGSLFSSFGSQMTVLGNDPNALVGKKFIEDGGVFYGDGNVFNVLQFPWLAGSPAVLDEPNMTVLTQGIADKYFGSWQSAVGQYIRLDNAITVKVAGILKDVPGNSDFPFKVVTSFVTAKNNSGVSGYDARWGSTTSNYQVFVRKPDNMPEAQLATALAAFSKKHFPDAPGKTKREVFLQSLSQIHFDTRVENFGDHVTNKSTLWTLSLIGVLIITMACINFINLSTAQAINRSKEVGIRKVLGSNRISLFWQMMGETAIIVFISVVLALVISLICLPFISHVASINDKLTVFTPSVMLFTLLAALVVTFLSGAYPALILSGFKPMLALKNKITSASIGGISLRRGLVVLQFSISQALIICTIIAISQMNSVKNADLGFNKEAVLVMTANADSVIFSRQSAFKQDLLAMNGIESVSFSSDVPSSENNWSANFAYDHKADEDFDVYMKFADEDYFKTFGLQFLAGNKYGRSDTIKDVVVNETMVSKLGVKTPADIIGKEMRVGRNSWKTIVGVVKDFKTNSLREDIKPLMISTRQSYYGCTNIKLKTSNLAQIRESIQRSWDKFFPEYAYDSYFMDESIQGFYQQENQLSHLYKIFSIIAILISCLGLYGLVSFMAVQRRKEVGVRKVLGASVAHVVYLFSKEFTILILIGFAIAAPLAWYVMNQWLGDFKYRINISIWIFALAMLVSIVIAWITVGYKSIRAALVNPVKSLRSE